jgi:hypothetical protein
MVYFQGFKHALDQGVTRREGFVPLSRATTQIKGMLEAPNILIIIETYHMSLSADFML